MATKLTLAVARFLLLVLLMHVAIFYFRLGWFLTPIWIAGLFFSFLVTNNLRLEFSSTAPCHGRLNSVRQAARCLATGVVRHAGTDSAMMIEVAQAHRLRMPMLSR